MSEPDYILAHKHCHHNRKELLESDLCGCFHCLRIYNPNEIEHWIDDDDTAICAHCPVDSVIAAKSGYPITQEFLQRMYDHWFGITFTLAEVREEDRSGYEKPNDE